MSITLFCPHCGAENAFGGTLCSVCHEVLEENGSAPDKRDLLHERYKLLEEVGAGGFGAVYRARDTRDNSLVAIKQINLKGLSPQEIIEATDAFNREAEILTTLSHPLLPRIFDNFSDPDHWYLVMTFIDGSTLDEYLQRQVLKALPERHGLPLSETLEIGLALCDVLLYLHTQHPPVIFRDLKPGNIMRTASGHLYLIDFGIARRFKPGQARDTIPFGSPGFAAPEQYGRAQTTPQADIYSMGALLYCLFSGDDPADHPFQFPPLRLYGVDGVQELDRLIQRLVALEPTQRPADIQQVRADLSGIQQLYLNTTTQRIWTPPQGQTPPADHATASKQQQIFATPKRSSAPKISRRGAVTAILLSIGAGTFILPRILDLMQPTPFSADNNSFDFGQSDMQQSTPISQTSVLPGVYAFWSPDLSHAAGLNVSAGVVTIYTIQNQRAAYTLGTWQISIYNKNTVIQWSPDNEHILITPGYVSGTVWDIKTQSSLFSLPSALQSSAIVAWSPDGKYIALGYQDSNNQSVLALLDMQSGKNLLPQNITSQTITSLSWSFDSKYFAFPSSDNKTWAATLEIWDGQTQEQVRVIDLPNTIDFSPGSTILGLSWSPDNSMIAFVLQTGQSTSSLWIVQTEGPYSAQKVTDLDNYRQLTYGPTWSPDGRELAALLSQSLAVWDATTGQEIISPDSSSNLIGLAWSADSQSITTVDQENNFVTQSAGEF